MASRIFYSLSRGRFSFRTQDRLPGIVAFIGGAEELIPDDEIPNLVSALQDYMSKRAREMAKARGRECHICRDRHPEGFQHKAARNV